MSVDELLICIENLDNEEVDRFLMLIKEKYNLTNKLPKDAFVVGENYSFWNNQEDDIYDGIYDNLKRK